MANFKDSPIFSTHDDYYTPKSAWEQIKHLITQKFGNNATILESFLLNSNEQSKKHLQELGFNVIGNKTIDFLNEDHRPSKNDYDLICSNPPFQRIKSFKKRKDNLKYKCIKGLIDNDKPFIVLMNSTNMFQKWSMELFKGKDIKFIFPSKKINYDKYEPGGVKKMKGGKSCSFNSIYVCYKVLDKNEWI